MHRMLCWLGLHEWAYGLHDDKRACVVCARRQYVATETTDGDKTWATHKQ